MNLLTLIQKNGSFEIVNAKWTVVCAFTFLILVYMQLKCW